MLLWAEPGTSDGLPTAIDPRFELGDHAALLADVAAATAASEATRRTRMTEVDAALATTREDYVAQRWPEMAATLSRIETEALPWLADPRHCATLWEIEFRAALAARGSGDAAAVSRHLGFALALDAERRPARELYGPDVIADFLDAVDAQTARVAIPVRLDVTPSDAVVHVDCRATRSSSVDLRPGRHVVHVRAMGHVTQAMMFEVPADAAMRVQLAADTEDPVTILGRGLASGAWTPELASHRRALVGAAASRGHEVVVVTGVSSEAFTARAWVGEGRSPVRRRASVHDAIAAALADLADDGTIAVGPGPAIARTPDAAPTKAKSKSIVRAWWLWTSIAVVAGLGLGLGLGFGLDRTTSDRVVIHGPR